MVLFPDLNGDKNGDQDTKENEENNDSPRIPSILGSAPLQSQEQAYDSWNECKSALQIKLLDASSPSQVSRGGAIRVLEVNNDDSDGN